ncbi:MAG TPA: tetratricopeptide repeat protein [Propionibacteriaceae bacterium]|nr:tetratricopeptide repeat protein [Propionibacteriaceae bacterium]
MAEQAKPKGGGTESLTRQDRLLYVLVENFQPVWREIEEAGVFRRRGLASRDGLLVPQHVMIGLVMLRGLLAEDGHDVITWAELAASREADQELARQFKRWMNALTDYFNGTRALSRADVGHLARGLTLAYPRPDLTADTLAGELVGYARPEPSAASREQRADLVSKAVQRPQAVTVSDAFLADVPPLLASSFQRREVQQQVTEILRTLGHPPLVLSGPAGVGKSQLAAAVLEDFAPDKVIWVSNAASRFAVLEAYARAAQALGLATPDPGNLEDSARSLMRALRRSDFDWWIVLDDVDDPADLVGLWPGGARGRTLWLTRRRGRDLEGEGRQIVTVEGFSQREGQRYLRSRLGAAVEAGEMVSHTFDEVDGLVHDLGGTPLALALAASVLRENRYTCANYRRLLAKQLDGLDGLFAEQTAEGYEWPLVAAWAISLNRAEQRDPTGLASWAALIIAVLNPAGVQAKIMVTEAVRRFLAAKGERREELASIDDLTRTTRALESYSLVGCTRYDTGTELKIREVQMHALTARMTRLHMGPAAVTEAVVAAADALMELWGEVENNPRGNLDLRGHAIWLERLRWEALASPAGVHPVLIRLGWSLGETGRPHRAARYFERLADRIEPMLGSGHPAVEDVQYARGVWHRKEGKIAKSIRELTALRDAMIIEGIEDERRAIKTRAELATSQGWSGQVHTACRDLTQIIGDAEKALPHDDPLILHVRYTHAVWTGRGGQHSAAAALLTEVLKSQRQILGDDHISTLKTRLELAVWIGQSSHDRALLQLLDQRDDWTRVCGTDHPYTLRMQHILAQYRGKIGDLNRAHTEMRAVYRRRRRVLGDRHPDTLKSRQDLAVLRGQLNDPQGAVFDLIKLLRDRLKIQGMRSIETFRTRRQLAEWIARAGHPETGLAELRYLEADLARFVENGHPELAEVAATIAELS